MSARGHKLNQGLPPMQPAQLGLQMPGCETPLEAAWRQQRRHLPGMTLAEALERPLVGRLLRMQARAIELRALQRVGRRKR